MFYVSICLFATRKIGTEIYTILAWGRRSGVEMCPKGWFVLLKMFYKLLPPGTTYLERITPIQHVEIGYSNKLCFILSFISTIKYACGCNCLKTLSNKKANNILYHKQEKFSRKSWLNIAAVYLKYQLRKSHFPNNKVFVFLSMTDRQTDK